jgi:hypothetical protein
MRLAKDLLALERQRNGNYPQLALRAVLGIVPLLAEPPSRQALIAVAQLPLLAFAALDWLHHAI